MEEASLLDVYNCISECNFLISTDSKTIPSGGVFFALRGSRFNGNDFALEALGSGARYCIVDDPALKGKDCFYVRDVLAALLKAIFLEITMQKILSLL